MQENCLSVLYLSRLIDTNMSKDSLTKRYFFKLLSSIITVPIAFFTQYFALRSLGPTGYGSYSYLTDFFLKILNFCDSSSTYFLSKKLATKTEHDAPLFYYLLYGLGIVTLLLLVSCILSVTKTFIILLPDQELKYIFLALSWAIFWWFNKILSFATDGKGLTKKGESFNIVIKIFGLGLLSFYYYTNRLSLPVFFVLQIVLLALNCIGTLIILSPKKKFISYNKATMFFKEAWSYSSPLLVLNIILLFSDLFDRWLLQIFSGTVEQGHFGIAFQISNFCILFTNAFTPLLFREFSIMHSKKEHHVIRSSFQKYLPFFFSLTAFFSIFLASNAKELALILGGKQFENASFTILIMALMPLYQSYGQICGGSVMLATEQTQKLKSITISTTLITIPITLFLLAPNKWWGLNLGASGLAIKMLLFQTLTVLLFLFHVCRYLKLSFKTQLLHQIFAIVFFGISALITKEISSQMKLPTLIHLIFHFGFYSALILIFSFKVNYLWSIDLKKMISKYLKRFGE